MKLSLSSLREHLDALQNLSDNLSHYFSSATHYKKHYWHGINFGRAIDYAQQQDFISLLNTLHTVAKQAHISHEWLRHYNIDESTTKIYKLERLEENDFKHAYLFSLIDNINIVSELEQCFNLLQNYQTELKPFIALIEASQVNLEQFSTLDAHIVNSSKLPSGLMFKDLQAISDRVKPMLAAFNEGYLIFREAAIYLGLSDQLNSVAAIQSITKIAAYCSKVEINTLSHRSPAIEQAVSNPIVVDMIHKIETLRQQRAEMHNQFDFGCLPDDKRLNKISKILSNKKFFSILSKEWRDARADYSSITKIDKDKNFKKAAEKIDALLSFKKNLLDLNENIFYNNLLTGIFKGINTDIDSLRTAINFYNSLQSAVTVIPTFGPDLYKRLCILESKNYEWLERFSINLCHTRMH